MEQHRAAKTVEELKKVDEIPFDKESSLFSSKIIFDPTFLSNDWIMKVLQHFFNFEDPQAWNDITKDKKMGKN